MKVSTSFFTGYAVKDWEELTEFALALERVGVAGLWSPEAWGHDGATPLAYLAAKTSTLELGTSILQVGARTPANLAMTAMSLYSMSGGRFKLGIGTSGPQVMEGWHGVVFDRPVQRTRETIEIARRIFRGERVSYEGELYRLPARDGEGKPLTSVAPPTPDLPIYVASLGPANLRLTGELADGWRGTSFMPEHADVFFGPMAEGAASVGRSLGDLDLQVGGTVWFTDDVDAAVEEMRPALAFSLGAMGSRRHNFYNNAYKRAGYADLATEIQDHWLAGKRDEARRLVPAEVILKTHLIGTDEMIADRIRAYRDAGVTTISARPAPKGLPGAEPGAKTRIGVLERFVDLVERVNAE